MPTTQVRLQAAYYLALVRDPQLRAAVSRRCGGHAGLQRLAAPLPSRPVPRVWRGRPVRGRAKSNLDDAAPAGTGRRPT